MLYTMAHTHSPQNIQKKIKIKDDFFPFSSSFYNVHFILFFIHCLL